MPEFDQIENSKLDEDSFLKSSYWNFYKKYNISNANHQFDLEIRSFQREKFP